MLEFLKRVPASLTDEELEEVALEEERRRGALEERERRIEAKREKDAQAAAAALARERQKRVAELRREHERAAEEARLVHVRLGAALVEAGKVLAERGAALARAWKAEEELAGLGERRPATPLPDFTREAELAARDLGPVVTREAALDPLREARGLGDFVPPWADWRARAR